MAHSLENSPSPGPKSGMLALAARLFWLVFGNAALFFLAVFIAKTGKLSLYDLAYWAVAAALVVVRLVDVTLLDGRTAEGEEATPAHWRRYAVIVSIVSLVLWILAYQATPFVPK